MERPKRQQALAGSEEEVLAKESCHKLFTRMRDTVSHMLPLYYLLKPEESQLLLSRLSHRCQMEKLLEGFLRIFTDITSGFLSCAELELLWSWEPTDSSEAQGTK